MILIDGYNGGVPHISASMIRDHNISLYGGDCVLNVGSKFGAEILDNSTVKIKDGMAVVGGARTIIEYGQSETMAIEAGVTGYKRHDIIVIEYSKDDETLKETTSLKVIKGELGTTGVDPEILTADVRAGAPIHQMALYRVKVNGLVIEKVEQMWVYRDNEAKSLLWQNASPTSAFAAQDITIDFTGYDYVEVLYKLRATYSQTRSVKFKKGYGARLTEFTGVDSSGNYLLGLWRNVSASGNTFTVSACTYAKTGSIDTNYDKTYIVPWKVYGIKGV